MYCYLKSLTGMKLYLAMKQSDFFINWKKKKKA